MAKKFYFPFTPRRDDPNSGLVVQKNADELAEAFDDERNAVLRGTATVGAGTANQLVTHNWGESTSYAVVLTPTSDPSAGIRWWVTAKTNDDFLIQLSGNAPVGGLPFDWVLRGDT